MYAMPNTVRQCVQNPAIYRNQPFAFAEDIDTAVTADASGSWTVMQIFILLILYHYLKFHALLSTDKHGFGAEYFTIIARRRVNVG